MEYKDYKIENFLADEKFKMWVLSSGQEYKHHWHTVVNANPQLFETIDQAKRIAENIGFRYEGAQSEEHDRVLENIIKHKTSDLFDFKTDLKHFSGDFPEVKKEKVVNLNLSRQNQRVSIFHSFSKIAAIIALVLGVSYGLYYINKVNIGSEQTGISTKLTTRHNPKGVKSHIQLPDGTHVWLNAASSISYGQDFLGSERNVQLEGEAYFEVVKDAKRPFHVTSGNVVTTALGTSFNIKAYTDKNVKVSLHTGKVKVHRKDSSEQVILLPGQQANAGVSGLSIVEFNNLAVLGWKDGTIVFDNTDFDEMISVLEKWYDVTFVVRNLSQEERREIKVFGEFENQTLDNVLKLLSHSMHFEYGIENKTVTLKFKTDT